jgi:hypothetical protein
LLTEQSLALDEIDIWRTAKILIDAHGEDASVQAALRADYALEDGLMEAVTVWTRVMKAIEELQRQRPGAGEPLN